jgi:hypothetical protein
MMLFKKAEDGQPLVTFLLCVETTSFKHSSVRYIVIFVTAGAEGWPRHYKNLHHSKLEVPILITVQLRTPEDKGYH